LNIYFSIVKLNYVFECPYRNFFFYLRGGGGSFLPEMVIVLTPTGLGGSGGASLITSGSGVCGLGGC
jgi:hypothetical protein